MGKRQLTRADAELLRDVERMLAPHEEPPSTTQLERWRQTGLIPEAEHVGGRLTRYPAGTAAQVLAVTRHPQRDKNLDKVALPLFFAGYPVSGDALRRAILGELARVRKQLERYAGTRKSRAQAEPEPQLTAARLAEKLVRGRLSGQTKQQAALMLAHLGRPLRWVPDDPPKDNLQTVYTFLFYVFLTGRLLPGSDEVFYQAWVAYGLETALTSLISADVAIAAVQTALADDSILLAVTRLSLPGLAKALAAMDTADFDNARRDCAAVVELFLFLLQVALALLPPDVARSMPWSVSKGTDWKLVATVAALPVLFTVRRSDAKVLDAFIAIARDGLPEWRANFEAALLRGVFSDEGKREALRAGMVETVEHTLASGPTT